VAVPGAAEVVGRVKRSSGRGECMGGGVCAVCDRQWWQVGAGEWCAEVCMQGVAGMYGAAALQELL